MTFPAILSQPALAVEFASGPWIYRKRTGAAQRLPGDSTRLCSRLASSLFAANTKIALSCFQIGPIAV
jgi:hypothetical protein